MPRQDTVHLTKVVVGGEPVGFTESTGLLHVAGADLTLEEWQEIERRINLFYIRSGRIPDPRMARARESRKTSSFLTHNLREVMDRKQGKIKRPPWWLRPFYSGIITKEELWEVSP